jgi:hypothetical protein
MTALVKSRVNHYAVFTYVLLLPCTLLLAALFWTEKISGVLYLCTDSLGVFDFIPPFVHPGSNDLFYVPAWRVHLIWWGLVVGAILLPLITVGILSRFSAKDSHEIF